MLVFKYLSPDRIDVLRNLTIRFTQPSDLNDPYETNPVITGSIMTDEEFDKIIQFDTQQNGLIANSYEALRSKSTRDEIFPQTLQIIKTLFHHTTGVLSLSEKFDNLLMWAHYCFNHRGYVIGFDASHPFFISKNKEFAIDYLSKVIYTGERPTSSLEDMSMKSLFFTKSNHWSYENEWRLLKNIADAEVKYQDGEIALFKLPPKCIKKIYLGASCSNEDENEIIELVKTQQLDAEIFKMTLNPINYDLNVIPIKEWPVYKEKLVNDDILPLIQEIKNCLYGDKKIRS